MLFGAEEAEELHFDDAGVVSGLDGEDALEDDFLGEDFFAGTCGEFVGDGSGDEVLEQAAVECSDERDGESFADDFGVAAEATEHGDLSDECGHEAEAGAELHEGMEEVVSVAVSFGHGFDFDAHDAFDDFGVGSVDGELEATAEEGVGCFSGGGFESEDAVAAGGFGVLDHLLDDVFDVGVFGEEPLFEEAEGAGDVVEGHGEECSAEGTAEDEEHFGGFDIGEEGAVGGLEHSEDDSAPGEDKADDRCQIHLTLRA